MANSEQIEALSVIIDGLRDYKISDADLVKALANLTKNTSVTIDSTTWTALTGAQIEHAIGKLTAKLDKFDRDAAAAAQDADTAIEADADGPNF